MASLSRTTVKVQKAFVVWSWKWVFIARDLKRFVDTELKLRLTDDVTRRHSQNLQKQSHEKKLRWWWHKNNYINGEDTKNNSILLGNCHNSRLSLLKNVFEWEWAAPSYWKFATEQFYHETKNIFAEKTKEPQNANWELNNFQLIQLKALLSGISCESFLLKNRAFSH